MSLRPLYDRIIVERVQEDEKTAGGIFIPETAKEKPQKGKIIAIVTEGDTEVKGMADYVIEIPETDEAFVPLLATIPLQLLAYHIAVMRGCNVDQPRNLAKSVTVE